VLLGRWFFLRVRSTPDQSKRRNELNSHGHLCFTADLIFQSYACALPAKENRVKRMRTFAGDSAEAVIEHAQSFDRYFC
jgi:hypothetical protein